MFINTLKKFKKLQIDIDIEVDIEVDVDVERFFGRLEATVDKTNTNDIGEIYLAIIIISIYSSS